MVSKQLGAVVGPVSRQALQPCRCPLVPVGSGSAWQVLVGDVANQHMAEGVLLLTSDCRLTL
jgi:hypothetical protein